MKWVEIITLRSPANNNMKFVDALLEQISSFTIPKYEIQLKIYHHSVVETDLSIHIYWESGDESPRKSPLGLSVASALKPFGLLNHSVWVETAAREIDRRLGCKADMK